MHENEDRGSRGPFDMQVPVGLGSRHRLDADGRGRDDPDYGSPLVSVVGIASTPTGQGRDDPNYGSPLVSVVGIASMPTGQGRDDPNYGMATTVSHDPLGIGNEEPGSRAGPA